MNDLISRQAAIDALNYDAELLRHVLDETYVVDSDRTKFEWGLGLIESCIYDMDELPSAQPKRMRGRWVKDEEASSQHLESIYVCSACNNMEAWGEVEKNTFKFCPNCGADMRGENNG